MNLYRPSCVVRAAVPSARRLPGALHARPDPPRQPCCLGAPYISGPNLAAETMAGQPAAATIACPDEGVAQRVQKACHTVYL